VEAADGGSVVVAEELSTGANAPHAWLTRLFPGAGVRQHASIPVSCTADGLPIIGEVGRRRWRAGGFGTQPMAFGMLAAMLLRDAVLGGSAPWSRIVSSARPTLAGGSGRVNAALERRRVG
jgi:glycine/D-amino acid oxidase-like deaminating enzyme